MILLLIYVINTLCKINLPIIPDPNELYVIEHALSDTILCDECNSIIPPYYNNTVHKYFCQCMIGITTDRSNRITCQYPVCLTYSTTGCFAYCDMLNNDPSGCPSIGSSPITCYNKTFVCCNYDNQNVSRIVHCDQGKAVNYTFCDANNPCNVTTGVCGNVGYNVGCNFGINVILMICIFGLLFV